MQIDDKRVEIDEAEERSILPLGDSILASWIRSISQTVRSYGIAPEPLMQKSGLDISLLTVPEARYPAINVRRFWECITAATGDDLIGLTCGQQMQVFALNGLGLAIVTARSLAQVLDLTARYCEIISSTMDMSLEHNAEGTTLSIRTLHGTEIYHSAILTIMAFILRQARSLAQHDVKPLRVQIKMPDADEATIAKLQEHFGCPVETKQTGSDCICFAYADLIEPYASANAILREANERVVVQYLNRVRKSSFTSRVEEEIESLLAEGEVAKIADVAAKLHLTERTLQRRLEHEGVNFIDLLERHRKRAAHDALAHTDQSITQIAFALGFADPSNFSRTCTRWFCVSPTAYRRRIRLLQT